MLRQNIHYRKKTSLHFLVSHKVKILELTGCNSLVKSLLVYEIKNNLCMPLT